MWVVPFSLEGSELNAESDVLPRDSGMTAEEESHETKQLLANDTRVKVRHQPAANDGAKTG